MSYFNMTLIYALINERNNKYNNEKCNENNSPTWNLV